MLKPKAISKRTKSIKAYTAHTKEDMRKISDALHSFGFQVSDTQPRVWFAVVDTPTWYTHTARSN